MTNLPGNPYAERLERPDVLMGDVTAEIMALAYEQRTANLIAYAKDLYGDADGFYKARAQVRLRLGIEDQ